MKYELHVDYKDTPELRKAFFAFAAKVFGISFDRWYDLGFWSDSYICYSLIDRGRMISNVSLSELEVLVDGKRQKAVQIATVGTLKEYRGQGLSRYLMEKVLADYQNRCDFFFLSANNSVVDFYPRFGFRRFLEYQFTAELPTVTPKVSARKLNLSDEKDLMLLRTLCQNRLPVSTCFTALNYTHILMAYVLNVYQDCVWYIDKTNTIVVGETEGNTLHLYDIITEAEIDIQSILPHLPLGPVASVIFHFTPDLMDIKVSNRPITEHDPFFVKGAFGLEGMKFKFPKLGQT